MNETILTLGVVFVATAIVGGGVSLMNNKMPVVDSPRRQVLLGGFGLLIIVLDYALLGNVKNSVATLPSPSVSSTPVIGLSSSPNPTPTPLPSATPAPSLSPSSLPVSPSDIGV